MERNTQQRQAILKAFEIAERPLAVQEILDLALMVIAQGLGVATIHTNLKALVGDKPTTVEMPGGVALYELPGGHHHHHFSCNGCQKVFDVDGCGLNVKNLVPNGFTLKRHEVLLYGFCDSCSR